jgi:hypothetical protein
MTRYLLRLTGALLFSISFSASAGNAQPSCPDELPPSSVSVAAGEPWRPFVEHPLGLHSATMSSGPPETLSQLRGVDLSKRGDPPSTLYEFGRVGYEDGKWLNCRYGEAGEITIARRLDDALKSCVITHTKRSPREREKVRITCK